MDEAELRQEEHGLVPQGEGWFVVNAREAPWWRSSAFGRSVAFEGEDAPFPRVGINIQILEPGQPNCMYHAESLQEDFLVLDGECILIVEEQERQLRAWDFVHCPPGTRHVFVGAGDGPCTILMVGARDPDESVIYPVSEVAARHGASVERETAVPREAYARFERAVPATYRRGDLP